MALSPAYVLQMLHQTLHPNAPVVVIYLFMVFEWLVKVFICNSLTVLLMMAPLTFWTVRVTSMQDHISVLTLVYYSIVQYTTV